MALAKRIPGTESTSDTLLHNGLYPRLILPSNRSTDVTTPITEPQKIFDRNMEAPIKKIEMSWAGSQADTLGLGRRPTYGFQIKPRNDTKQGLYVGTL